MCRTPHTTNYGQLYRVGLCFMSWRYVNSRVIPPGSDLCVIFKAFSVELGTICREILALLRWNFSKQREMHTAIWKLTRSMCKLSTRDIVISCGCEIVI